MLIRSVRTNQACNFQDIEWKSARPTTSRKAGFAPTRYWIQDSLSVEFWIPKSRIPNSGNKNFCICNLDCFTRVKSYFLLLFNMYLFIYILILFIYSSVRSFTNLFLFSGISECNRSAWQTSYSLSSSSRLYLLNRIPDHIPWCGCKRVYWEVPDDSLTPGS